VTTARFKVYWRFDGTSEGTVEINRSAGTFAVRPHRRHKAYELPLAYVAQLIAERVIKAEAFRKRMEKAKARVARRISR
jgi:hypothetical protein